MHNVRIKCVSIILYVFILWEENEPELVCGAVIEKSSTIYHYYVTICPANEVGLHFIRDDLLILWMGCCLFTTHKNSQKLKYSIDTCSFNCPCALLMHFNCKEKEKVQCPTLKCYIPGPTNNCSADRAVDTGRSLIHAVQYLTLLHEIHKQHYYQPLNQDSKPFLYTCWQTKFSEIWSTPLSY